MNKKEVAKELRKRLTKAIQMLPDDGEYTNVVLTCDTTGQDEDGVGTTELTEHGNLHVFELIVEEKRNDNY